MKKIININLSGRVIPIEDTAYESLQRYIESLRKYFAGEEGRDEIINDIESRIAELMSGKINKGATAITDADIEEIIHSMGRVEDFEAASAEDAKTTTSASFEEPKSQRTKHKGRLYRDGTDKILGGVCSGIANYMNVDPAIVRFLFAIITFGGFGIGFLIYIILWIILPVANLESYVGKRLFRNPDDKVIAGVAGGLAAYFNRSSGLVRLIFALPIILNIAFGIFNGIFFSFHRDVFPNLFIGSFTGTFILTYIILWIVLPEATSPFEKMEMRGEKVDVNRIRQNVKDEMENFKTKAQSWGEEVKTTAQQYGEKVKEFATSRSKTFAKEIEENAKPIGRGIGHIIGVIFKAFFIFIAACIALSLFAALMVLIFGGVAWWPVNNFLWTSNLQKSLAWGTIILFLAVPLIGFMVWLIRRIVRVRSRNNYLGWIFGGLWTIGWICVIGFIISIAKDIKAYEAYGTDISITQPVNAKMIVKVNEPEIHTTDNIWWLHTGGSGLDITDDTMRYNNVKVRVVKSDDSLYHVKTFKYSAGRSVMDAQSRAANVRFNSSYNDSVLYLGSGLAIDRNSKFRGQGVIVEIQVPEGKKIRFDESIFDAYDEGVIRKFDRNWNRGWRRYNRNRSDWDYDEYFNWEANVDYIMQTDGELISIPKLAEKNAVPADKDSLRAIQVEQKRVRDSIDRELKKTEQELKQKKNSKKNVDEEENTTMLAFPTFSIINI
ncbi:MAG: PspC domain-containing protein [Flavisolibacter sp.]